VNVDDLVAIDVHVHAEISADGHPALPDRWLADSDTLDIRPEVRPLILKENAARLLGLREPGDA